jgi:imidazolonepropionase
MLRCGTTTAEVKSGYGLDTAQELKMLRAIRQLDLLQPIDLVATFLGAHESPPEFRDRRQAFVECVIHEMIPAVARDGLAEWCDVFCEDGVFTPEESIAILEAGRRAALKPRIHADELASSGGALAAAAVRARSADHLVHVAPAGIAALSEAGCVATLLPAAAFYLKLGRFAPARALITAGVPVALGTDINPGGGFSGSMAFAMTLACFGMDMTLEEALIAATLNAAYSIDRDRESGSLETGKAMDAVIVRGDPVNLLRLGSDAIAAVIKRGRIVFQR